jgi:hypothetical protein
VTKFPPTRISKLVSFPLLHKVVECCTAVPVRSGGLGSGGERTEDID